MRVSVDLEFLAASLRYFDSQGAFAAAVRDAVGVPLPQPLHVTPAESVANAARFMLIWRSPTEILLLSKDSHAFTQLERRLADAEDGCMVDQSGGIRVVRLTGSRTGDLLVRLGANELAPSLGEARTGRLAELQVTAVRVLADEVLLLVERVYADHLLEWLAVSARDL